MFLGLKQSATQLYTDLLKNNENLLKNIKNLLKKPLRIFFIFLKMNKILNSHFNFEKKFLAYLKFNFNKNSFLIRKISIFYYEKRQVSYDFVPNDMA